MNQQTKKLTIVFPIYQSHKMLERALHALRDQTFKDFRVVILDDCSPEGYEDLVNKFQTYFPIIIDRNEKNVGAKDNMWKSLHYATDSEYLFSHHADDFIKTDYLERAIALLDTDKNISFAITGPEWVHANVSYQNKKTDSDKQEFFTSGKLALNFLNFAPYMFGSTIYRTKHALAVTDWSYPRMHGYFDRHYLGLILETFNSQGVFLLGNGIFERDHSLDLHDDRGDEDTLDDAINLLAYYKHLLQKEYPPSFVNKIITNQILFFFRNFDHHVRGSFRSFYKKQKKYQLIRWRSLRALGLFSLLTMHISQKGKKRMLQVIRKIKL